MRQICSKGIHDRDRLAPVADTHMDMHTESLNSAGKPLQLLDKFGIALNGCHLCIPPVADGMRSCTGKNRTACLGDSLKLRDCRGEIVLGLRDRTADAGNDLNGRLHEFVAEPGQLPLLAESRQLGEYFTSILAEHPGAAVNELQLPFDTQRRAA